MNFAPVIIFAFILLIIRKFKRMNYPFKRPVSPFSPRIDERGNWWFGAQRKNSFGYHRGIDIEVSGMFQPVFAPFSGIVSKKGTVYNGDSKWKYIEIWGDAPNEIYKVRLLYCTLLPFLKEGDSISEGEQIGETQDISIKHNDGIKSPMLPHLHIEVIKNGKWIDPAPFFGVSRSFI